jgi:hypothetical protein
MLSGHGAPGELVAINLASDRSASTSLWSFGGGRHIVMVVVMVVMVVMMVMVVMLMGHRGGRRGVLRGGVASEADRKSGGDDKALDHGQSILR